ncbi:MAG: ABC transporter ATP-binding protein [Negativicutes bacterium]|jgi:putative ABC transport system ATP-binding protein
MSGYVIDLRNLVKSYRTEAGDFLALKGLDLQIESGVFAAVVGKSGCGKSTLINMIAGIDRPTGGECWVAGSPIHNFSENQMAVWRGNNLGVIYQFFQLLPTLTAMENVLLPMDFRNKYTAAERLQRAEFLLETVGLGDQLNKLPTTMSGGQQQRVAIARSLANDPAVVLADEPTGNLDSRTANEIFELFERLAAQGKTFVMVTHDNDLASRAGRIIRLADGEIVSIENRLG